MISPLKINDLVVKYGNFTAVSDFHLELSSGEIFGLLGPNGAGKTSTISCIVTLETPDSGEISIFGIPLKTQPLKAKSLIGYVPQEIINHGYFSVLEIMGFHSGFYGRRKNGEYIDYLLQRLGLYEHRNKRVKQLSGGMKRRLMIGKALVHKPQLLLLDEPTAGVDIDLRENLWEFVRELQKEGVTILLTTHYLEEAESLCDRIGIIHRGQLLRQGPTQSLIKELTNRLLKIDLIQELDFAHPRLVKVEGKTLIFDLPARSKIGDILKDLGPHVDLVEDIHLLEGNLEEAFRKIVREG